MDSTGANEQRIQRWLDVLRDGSEADKIAARRGLAGVFEERGMLAEAIELLETNIEAGARSAETLRWLSRLYQAQGDEASSLAAAVTASQDRLTSHPSELPEGVEVGDQTTRPPASRMLRNLLMVIGLSIAVVVVLWLLMRS
jgi:hypothetical protein